MEQSSETIVSSPSNSAYKSHTASKFKDQADPYTIGTPARSKDTIISGSAYVNNGNLKSEPGSALVVIDDEDSSTGKGVGMIKRLELQKIGGYGGKSTAIGGDTMMN